jgi:hypothetical protein
MPTKPDIKIKYSSQEIDNLTFDEDFAVNTVEILGYDGTSLQRFNADNMATKITSVGDITYIGIATPGTAQGTAKWQCKKIDSSGDTVITWADGNANFDNVATDLTALTYA